MTYDAPDSSRRRWLRHSLGAAALAGSAPWASLSFAAAGADVKPRLVFVILRGGLDGLWAVPAIGDPAFAEARGALAQYASEPLALDGRFALHPNLAKLHAAWSRGELIVLHAVGQDYHERSHFDAQQVLESGGLRPYQLATGWLGRALGAQAKGMALTTTVPLALRGPAAVDTWAPSTLPEPSADLVQRLERLYAGDPALAGALARAKALHGETQAMADGGGMGGAAARGGNFVALAQRAAEFIVQPSGPQAAVLELGGWDGHANLANPNGAFANNLRQLDDGLATLRDGLAAGGAWPQTVVIVATEFGRTVAINGTQGSDHGSGGVAFVLGGKLRGGRVLADWPGLAPKDRFEGRDLRSTTDLRSLFKTVLADHLQLPARTIERTVLPGSAALPKLALFA